MIFPQEVPTAVGTFPVFAPAQYIPNPERSLFVSKLTAVPDAAATGSTFSFKNLLSAGIGTITVENIISALILLILCLLVIRLTMHLLRKLLARSKLDERIRRYAESGVKALLYIVTGFIVMDSLGVSITSLVALLSVCGLALSLAVEGILGNMAGGLVILVTKPFAIGDFIEASGVSGTVAEITLNCTKLDTYDGRRVLLPNKELSASRLTNYSSLGRRRIEHRICVSYDAPLETVRTALLEAAAQTPSLLPDPAPTAQVEKYGESAIEYSIRCWAATEEYWTAYYDLLHKIKGTLDRNGAEMTYNHINVHIQEP